MAAELNDEQLINYAACQWYLNGSWYDFTRAVTVDAQTYASLGENNTQMYFSLCTPLQNTQNAGAAVNESTACAGQADNTYAFYQNGLSSATTADCTNYSTTSYDSLSSEEYGSDSIQIVYKNGDNTFKVGMVCDKNIDKNASVIGPLVSVSANEYSTTLTGDLACSTLSFSAIFDLIAEYNWLFAIIFMVVGIPFIFAGRKLFSVVVFIVGTLMTVALVMLLFYSTFLDSNTEYWVFWLVLSLSIIAGLAVGFVLTKCQKLGAACVAGWGGWLFGMFISLTFLYYTQQNWLFWVFNIACACVAAGLAFCFYFPVIITVTSFAGSYMFIRGISLFWPESFPNEFTTIDDLKNGYIDHISNWFWLYFGFIILLTIVGMVVQCKHLKKEKEEQGEDNIHHPYANRF